MHCEFDPIRITEYIEGALPEGDRREVERHLDGCSACSGAVCAVSGTGRDSSRDLSGELQDRLIALGEAGGSPRLSPAPVPLSFRGRGGARALLAAAAAVLLVAGGVFASLTWGNRIWGTDLFGGEPHVQVEERGAGHWRWEEPNRRMVVEEGSVRVRVHPGMEGMSVKTPVGEVRVLGTTFSVRVISVPMSGFAERDVEVATVMLEEGRVLLVTDGGEKPLEPGGRGILAKGIVPHLVRGGAEALSGKEAAAGWESLLNALRGGDRREVSLRTALLSLRQEPVAVPEEIRAALTPREEKWLNEVQRVLGWKESDGEPKK